MKTKHVFFIACATLLACACQPNNEPTTKKRYIAHAGIEDQEPSFDKLRNQGEEISSSGVSGSRGYKAPATHLDGNDAAGYKVCWSAGDEFILLAVNGSFTFGLIEGKNTTNGTFAYESDRELSGSEFVAYYPTTLNYNQGNIIWPSEQHFVPGGCAEAPMKAIIEGTPIQRAHDGIVEVTLPDLHFQNLGGLLRLGTSAGYYAKSIRFQSTSPATDVTLDCGGVLVDANQYVYLALPEGNYSGVSLTFTGYDGLEVTKTLKAEKSIVVTRSEIVPLSLPVSNTISVPDGLAPETINGVVAANQDFAGGATFSYHALTAYGDLVTAVWGDDWRLPTKAELEAMRLTGNYWSSESSNINDAWGCNNGAASQVSKTESAKVRPVKR